MNDNTGKGERDKEYQGISTAKAQKKTEEKLKRPKEIKIEETKESLYSTISSMPKIRDNNKAILLEYVYFRLTPLKYRDTIKTEEDFEENYGVTRETLYAWRRKPWFNKLLSLGLDEMRDERLQKVRQKLYETTSSGNVKAIDLFLRFEAGWNPIQKQESDVNHSLSGDTIARLVRESKKGYSGGNETALEGMNKIEGAE